MNDLILPDAGQWINALEAGQRARMTSDKQAAQTKFGQGLMTGDYQGAANAVAGVDPQLALGTLKYGQGMAGTQRAQATSAALARGDYAAAAQAAQGDPAAMKLIGDNVSETTDFIATHIQALKGKPLDQARQIYRDQIVPQWVARGHAAGPLLQWDPTPENIQAAEAEALGLKEALAQSKPMSVGGSLVDPRTGRAIYNAPVKLGDTDTLVQVGVDGAPAPPGLPPATPGPAPAPTAPTPGVDAGAPRGLRNNNPLNLQSTVGWDGMTGSDGKYAIFNSPDAGWNAADRNLQTYATKHGLNTVASVVNRWAPPSENDTAGYIAKVSARLGVDPAAPMNMSDPMVRRHMLEAMAEVENGQPVKFGQGGGGLAQPGPQAAPAADGPMTAPGVTVLARGQGKAAEEDTPLTPDAVELLAGKYLNNGTLPPMGAGKTGTRNRSAILNKATELAHGLGLTADDLVAGTASVHAAGKALDRTSQTIAANTGFEQTAIKNADLMLQLAPKGGGQSNIPVVNRWLQAGRKQVLGDPDVTGFDAALGAFSEEYAKVMTGSLGGTAATEGARHDAAERLGRYATQGQLAAGVAVMKQEMANRTNSLREVQSGLRDTIHAAGRGAAPGPDVPELAPAAGALPPQAAAQLQEGHNTTFANGQVWTKRAGQPVRVK